MNNATGKERILIVDDELTNIKLLGNTLKTHYQVSFATNGQAALRIAQSNSPPDLILLDIMMPDMDGYAVCRQLKSNPLTQHIPLIFITAMSEVADETRGLELGAVDYIIKPFSMAIVKARVRTHLELKRHRDMLEKLSAIDGLTGIANRRRFDEYLESEWRKALRDRSRLSLIMIDIDYFKRYNDWLGHLAGDACLKRIAHAIVNSCQRPSDLCARYGGEEFAIVLPQTDNHGAKHVATTIQSNLGSMKVAHERSPICPVVTVSIGISTLLPTPQTQPTDLVKTSDKALYEAKSRGRNQIVSIDF